MSDEEDERPRRGLDAALEGAALKALQLEDAALTRVRRAKARLTMSTESAAAWVKKRLEQRRRIAMLVRDVETTRSESRAMMAPLDGSEPSPSRAGSSTPGGGRRVAFRGAEAADARPRSTSSQVTVDLPEVAVRSGSLYLDGSKVESAFQKSSNGMDVFDVVIHHLLSVDMELEAKEALIAERLAELERAEAELRAAEEEEREFAVRRAERASRACGVDWEGVLGTLSNSLLAPPAQEGGHAAARPGPPSSSSEEEYDERGGGSSGGEEEEEEEEAEDGRTSVFSRGGKPSSRPPSQAAMDAVRLMRSSSRLGGENHSRQGAESAPPSPARSSRPSSSMQASRPPRSASAAAALHPRPPSVPPGAAAGEEEASPRAVQQQSRRVLYDSEPSDEGEFEASQEETQSEFDVLEEDEGEEEEEEYELPSELLEAQRALAAVQRAEAGGSRASSAASVRRGGRALPKGTGPSSLLSPATALETRGW